MTEKTLVHPQDALVDASVPEPPVISPVEHFAGTEKFQKKAMEIQKERGGE